MRAASRVLAARDKENMMSKVGVLLSGCGVEDGSEVYEAVLTILALERAGAFVQAIAPDVEQPFVYNHYTGQEDRSASVDGGRRVLAESARIVRGQIISVGEISAHDLDALVVVGGYGVLKNLCSYDSDGLNARINADVERLIVEMSGLGKPIGAMCCGPMLLALALRDKAPTLTVGDDAEMSMALQQLGARVITTQVNEVYVDADNSIVTTAAFMLGKSILEIEPGIQQLVSEVLRMARALGPGHTDPHATTYAPLDAGLNTINN
jgi:enhancing lycopene biosynthesis protein 2